MIPQSLSAHTALFLDVDGTLIDIAPHPDAVFVPPDLLDDLRRIEFDLQGAVALISGRTIANLDLLFMPLRLRASGVHGAEYRFGPNEEGVFKGTSPLPPEVWQALVGLINDFPGTMAENKTYSFAVHYRSAPHAQRALEAALATFIDTWPAVGLRIMPGHFVFEIKRADVNKGVAVQRFLEREEFRGRQPIFVGDDVTDWPAFAAAVDRGGFAYSVGAIAPRVSGTFPDPTAVRHWLHQTIHSQTVNA